MLSLHHHHYTSNTHTPFHQSRKLPIHSSKPHPLFSPPQPSSKRLNPMRLFWQQPPCSSLARPRRVSGWLPRQAQQWRSPRRLLRLSCFQRAARDPRISSKGFFSTTPTLNVEYGYYDGVEDPSQYRPGGFHPVQIGDRLHRRPSSQAIPHHTQTRPRHLCNSLACC